VSRRGRPISGVALTRVAGPAYTGGVTKGERLLFASAQAVVAAAIAMTSFAILVAVYDGRECFEYDALFWLLVALFSLSVIWGLGQLVRMASVQFGSSVGLPVAMLTGAALYLVTGFVFTLAYQDQSEWILVWIVGVLFESGVLDVC